MTILIDGCENSIEDVMLRSGFIAPSFGNDEIEHEFDDIGRSHFTNLICFQKDPRVFEKNVLYLLKMFHVHSVVYIEDKQHLVIEHQDPEIEYNEDYCYCSY